MYRLIEITVRRHNTIYRASQQLPLQTSQTRQDNQDRTSRQDAKLNKKYIITHSSYHYNTRRQLLRPISVHLIWDYVPCSGRGLTGEQKSAGIGGRGMMTWLIRTCKTPLWLGELRGPKEGPKGARKSQGAPGRIAFRKLGANKV